MHHPQPIEPQLAEVTVKDGEPDWYTMTVWLEKGQTPRFIFPNGMQNCRNAFSRIARDYKDQWPKDDPYDGGIVEARIIMIDSGGHYTDEVYQFCKRHGVRRFVPVKGHNVMGKPIASWPRKRNDKGVYLTMIGTDTAKEIIADRLKITEPGDGYMHYPVSGEFDEDYFKHLTNERRIMKVVKGRRVWVWDAGGRRNEPFDLSVYNLAGVRVLQQHFGVRLPAVERADKSQKETGEPQKQAAPAKRRQKFNDYGEDWI